MDQVFDIGDKIEITPVKSAFSYDKAEKKYASQVLDFDRIRTCKISAPVQDGRLIPLRIDEDIDLCFFTKAGLYQCRSRVKKRYVDNKLSVLDVLFISEPQKFQRRRFYRLECTFDIRYRRLSREEVSLRSDLDMDIFESDVKRQECIDKIEALPKEWREATITNLSGGGVRFHLSEELDVGEPIEVMVPLSLRTGVVPMKTMAHVIDCIKSGARSADARLEFDSISNKEREIIVKYVFEEQRRRMSGGER